MFLKVLFWLLMGLSIIDFIFGWAGGPSWMTPSAVGILFVEVFILGLKTMGNPLAE